MYYTKNNEKCTIKAVAIRVSSADPRNVFKTVAPLFIYKVSFTYPFANVSQCKANKYNDLPECGHETTDISFSIQRNDISNVKIH
jgi:hypothetical protein